MLSAQYGAAPRRFLACTLRNACTGRARHAHAHIREPARSSKPRNTGRGQCACLLSWGNELRSRTVPRVSLATALAEPLGETEIDRGPIHFFSPRTHQEDARFFLRVREIAISAAFLRSIKANPHTRLGIYSMILIGLIPISCLACRRSCYRLLTINKVPV